MLSSGDSAMHGYLHTNKYSVLASHSLFQDEPVASQADLVIFDPEHLPNMDYLTDIDINTCAVSWYGLTGRYSSFKGSNAAVHALSGLMRGIGAVEGPPVIPPGYQAQMIGGLSAFNGALGHLLAQRLGNLTTPFKLDASILEANMCFTDLGAINAYNENPLPPRMGINRFPPT